jgi:hypothetical protein
LCARRQDRFRLRVQGEAAAAFRDELARAGVAADAVGRQLREADSARALLEWAHDGDVLALPIHAAAARDAVVALLDRLQATGWVPGRPLPAADAANGAGAPSARSATT